MLNKLRELEKIDKVYGNVINQPPPFSFNLELTYRDRKLDKDQILNVLRGQKIEVKEYYYNANFQPIATSPIAMYSVVDRSNSIISTPLIKVYSPIGRSCTPNSIDEICYNAASAILRKSKGKIYVLWSGGIDSTLTLIELMKITPLDKIVVVLTDYSMAEYPWFYERYLTNMETVFLDMYSSTQFSEFIKDGGVIVSGNLLDEQFGSLLSEWLYQNPDIAYNPFDRMLETVDENSFNLYKLLAEASPMPITNVKEFLWWLEYCLDYQNVEFRLLLENPELRLDENIFNFGGGQEWNDYAVSTPMEIKCPPGNYSNFKIGLKKLIYEFTNDLDYFEHKTKVASWRRYRTKNMHALSISTDWKYQYV